MNRLEQEEIWKAGLHRELSASEEARLESAFLANPVERTRFEEELALNQLLRDLPPAPLSSNFTARVMSAAREEHRRKERTRSSWHHWWDRSLAGGWGRKLAFASALLALCFVSYQQYQLTVRRELARSVWQVSTVLPGQDVIGDFSAIDGLRQVAQAPAHETDLLDALQ